MSTYDATIAPPLTFEVIERIRTLLQADAELQGALGGGPVLIHELPIPEGTGPQWRRIVVREPIVLGGRPQRFTLVDGMPVFIKAEIKEAGSINFVWWLQQVHARIYSLIVMQRFEMEYADHLVGLKRESIPTPAEYDEVNRSRYSSARYRTFIGPKYTDE